MNLSSLRCLTIICLFSACVLSLDPLNLRNGILTSAEANTSCPLLQCSKTNLEGEACTYTREVNITAKDGSVFTQTLTDIDTGKCTKNGKTCPPLTPLGYQNCTENPHFPLVDGDSCKSAIECASGNCKDNKTCVGIDNGALCSNTLQCKVGSYCTGNNASDPSSVCKEQVKENGTCSSVLDCVNSHTCHEGICKPLFSLADGTNFTPSMNLLECSSGFAYGGVCTQFIYLGSRDYKWFKGQNCSYNFTAKNQTEILGVIDGECAWDGTFQKYCPRLGTEHDLFKDYIKHMKDWFFGPALQLHSTKRNNYPDESRVLYYKVSNFPHLINADKCAISLYSQTSSASAVKVGLFALFGSLILLFL